MNEKAIITSASNKFFPSLINLLGSIKKNYPNHPTIYVYDLGLFISFRKELEIIENVKIIKMPKFAPYWNSCYTWKTYILAHPLAELNLYLDAGNEILYSLEEIFNEIEKNNYYVVSQGKVVTLEMITPNEYKTIFNIEEKYYKDVCFTAGIVGFKSNTNFTELLNKLYNLGKSGLCLGFSIGDQHRNKGKNKTNFIRDCVLFRHDTTLFSLLLRQYIKPIIFSEVDIDGSGVISKKSNKKIIWNLRLNFNVLNNTQIKNIHKKNKLIILFNHIYIKLFLLLKKLNLKIKILLGFKGLFNK